MAMAIGGHIQLTYRSDGTECASCCGACRSLKFPSLFTMSVSIIRAVVCAAAAVRTHFDLFDCDSISFVRNSATFSDSQGTVRGVIVGECRRWCGS